MGMGDAIKNVFKNYMNFDGRARRSEFWYFMLFNGLVSTVLMLILPLWAIWQLAALIPTLTVSWRRLHDTGRSGAYWCLNFLPIVGSILFIIMCTEDSKPGDNVYGPNPKGIGAGGYPAQFGGYNGGTMPVNTPPQPRQQNSFLGVRCLAGPLQGQTYTVGTQGLSFGTDVSNMVRLPAGTPGVSRVHCAIRWQQGVPVLVDLGSTYGTFMGDERRLPREYPERVAAGSRFYLGGRGVLFEIVNI